MVGLVILGSDDDLVVHVGLEGEVDGEVGLVRDVIIRLNLVVGESLIVAHLVDVEIIKPL